MLAEARPCEMIFPTHPDDPNPRDIPCVNISIGRTEDKVYVCEKCAIGMLKEGFTVHPLDYEFTK